MDQHPSLLGLAPELRQLIYGHVNNLTLEAKVIDQVRGRHMTHTVNATLKIPWLNLARTCRAIRTEIRTQSLMIDSQCMWELDLHVLPRALGLGPLVWRRLSCPPGATRILAANIEIGAHGLHLWGDGGPHRATTALYQTLNHVLHCGAFLDPRRPLPQHMRLQRLFVNMISHPSAPDRRHVSDGEHRSEGGATAIRDHWDLWTFEQLCDFVSIICENGILSGYVDQVQVAWGEQVREFKADGTDHAPAPEEWNEYGFIWGIA